MHPYFDWKHCVLRGQRPVGKQPRAHAQVDSVCARRVWAGHIVRCGESCFLVAPVVYGPRARCDEWVSRSWRSRVGANSPLPLTVLTEPPYEVSETGWGAFEIGIDIYVRDPTARAPLRRQHLLRLYPDGAGGSSGGGASGAAATDKPVISELYDEIVFNALPDDAEFRDALLRGPVLNAPPYPYVEHLTVFSPEVDLAQITVARKYIADRVEELEERLVKAQASRAVLQHKHLPDLGIA